MKGTLDISSYLSNPKLIGEQEIKLLTQELELMPWCSTYRMLVAKGFDNENSFQKNKNLRLAATYAGDRESLFLLIHNQKQKVLVSEDIVEEEELPNEPISVDLVPEEINVNEEIVTEIYENDIVEESKNIDEPEVVSEKQENQIEERSSGSKLDFNEIVTYDPIKELQEVEGPQERERTEIDFDYVAYDPEKELNKLIEEKEEEVEHDFLFWLNNIEDDTEKLNKSKQSAKSPDKVQELLDQFLATKRSRPIQNRKFYNVQNKAEESETDNMDVVSETLLELYVKQGYFDKAIEGYLKLSLQSPLKTAYFAARITELQELNKEL